MIYYLGVRFTRETDDRLHAWRAANGLAKRAMPKLGFHSTIAYSHTPFGVAVDLLPSESIGTAKTAAVFGTSLVLTYRSPWLTSIHRTTRQAGATWDHARFDPHVTVVEGFDPGDLNLVAHRPVELFVAEIFYREYP